MRTLRANRSGFTLIELMIVTALIGILATIAAPKYLHHRNKTRVASTIASSEGIRAALAGFAAASSNNQYPAQGNITTLVELKNYVNAHGSTLPKTPPFYLMSYGTSDTDNDGLADDYSIRFSVQGVYPPTIGSQVLVTPGGIFRCSDITTASCLN